VRAGAILSGNRRAPLALARNEFIQVSQSLAQLWLSSCGSRSGGTGVIAPRMLHLASGGTRVYNEMARMGIEQMTAFAEAQVAAAGAATAGHNQTTAANCALTVIKKHVDVNQRRLLRR
jgi:hypothetical protein